MRHKLLKWKIFTKFMKNCTAIGNLDHSLKQDCGILALISVGTSFSNKQIRDGDLLLVKLDHVLEPGVRCLGEKLNTKHILLR